MNNRTHRKLLVVDGRVGFTGGVGIADEWTGNAQDPTHWRDSHFQVEGPVVAQMQAAFMDNWIKATGDVLHGERYFPALAPAGDGARADVQQLAVGRQREHAADVPAVDRRGHADHRPVERLLRARRPDACSALVAAVKRGVQRADHHARARSSTRRRCAAPRAPRWGPLLEAGVEIYEYQPTMYHCKVMIVDDLLVSVGSTNFDNRSFRLNDEANLNIYDAAFATAQARVFEADLKQSKPITFAQWKDRPWHEKLMEHLAALLSPQL